jgi:methylthioribose-1-phosphate isomerase
MLIQNKHYRSIWLHPSDPDIVQTFDQRKLPFEVVIVDLKSPDDAHQAIRSMLVRGAPLIGATGAFGLYLAVVDAEKRGIEMPSRWIQEWKQRLHEARPTAVNLRWALDRVAAAMKEDGSYPELKASALKVVDEILSEEIFMSKMIGEFGLEIIREISRKKGGKPVNILTHCNAGWIACIDYGTATAPIYLAKEEQINVHVWVDETRPRNQGARLTAWELSENSISHHLITDNAGGHLMQHGMVDLVIVGSDRTTRNGDSANKIGTYLKALAAYDNNIPFYVALPSSTIDWDIRDGLKEIPIEERSEEEVLFTEGWDGDRIIRIRVTDTGTSAVNHGFDVTPARLITGLITERGICEASEAGLLALFPEKLQGQEEGYIKFRVNWKKEPGAVIPAEWYHQVNASRDRMVEQGLIGCFPGGIGFGNISIRNSDHPQTFFITGSATGHYQPAPPEAYSLVERWNLSENTLWCKGPVKASSESMSHAVIYSSCPDVQCVIHIHSIQLWRKAIGNIPTTPAEVAYGTPEMAEAIRKLIEVNKLNHKGIIAMGGHEEGLVLFGRDFQEAERELLWLQSDGHMCK